MLPINRNPGAGELRAFARIWFPLFVVVAGGLTWWRGASAEAARIFFVGMMTITYPIGLVISTVVLAFMFYVVFTPLGFVMRLGGRDPLQLKKSSARTQWTPYDQDDSPERAFRQY